MVFAIAKKIVIACHRGGHRTVLLIIICVCFGALASPDRPTRPRIQCVFVCLRSESAIERSFVRLTCTFRLFLPYLSFLNLNWSCIDMIAFISLIKSFMYLNFWASFACFPS